MNSNIIYYLICKRGDKYSLDDPLRIETCGASNSNLFCWIIGWYGKAFVRPNLFLLGTGLVESLPSVLVSLSSLSHCLKV